MRRLASVIVLFALIGCQKQPIIIGDFNCENRVTFEQLRDNPEPYMYKEICFEVGNQLTVSAGVDVVRKDDKKLIARYKNQKHTFIEDVIDSYQQGDTSFLPDAGIWYIYYNSILPIQLAAGHYGAFDSIENKYTIPDEYIDSAKGEFVFNSENTDSLLFSGILFESKEALKDSVADALTVKYGKRFAITRNHVYLTGAKIIEQ